MADEQGGGQAQQAPSAQSGELSRGLVTAVSDLIAGSNQQKPSDQEQPRGDEKPADPGAKTEPGELSTDGLGLQSAKGPGGGADKDAVTGLQKLAEQAGVSIEELYKTEIQLGDDRGAVSIGDLKDQFQDFQHLSTQRDDFTETRRTFENDMIRGRAELQAIVAMLPQIPPEMIQQAQAQHAASVESERAALHSVMPEWKDPAVYSRVQDQILDSVSEYGFTRSDLDNVIDHRLTKLLWDFHTMRERFAAANAGRKRQVEEHTTSRAKGSERTLENRDAKKQLDQAKAAPMHSSDKVAAVSALLNQGNRQ